LESYINLIIYSVIITISSITLYISLKTAFLTPFDNALNLVIIYILVHQLHLFIVNIFFPRQAYAWEPYSLMYGPLLFYCSHVLQSEKLNLRFAWFHVMPFLIAMAIYIWLVFLPISKMSLLSLYDNGLDIAIIISLLFYAVLFLIEKKPIMPEKDNNKKILDQLVPLLFFSGLFFLLIKIYSEHIADLYFLKTAVHLLLLFAVLILFVFKVRKAFQFVKPPNKIVNSSESLIKEKTNYRKSGLSVEQLQAFEIRLNLLMSDRKLYLQEDLSLEILAKRMKVSKHNLSELFSKHIGKNYNQFINEHRIFHACAIINNKDLSFSTEKLMMECGFRNKNTFLTAFKNSTGLTPDSYRLKQSYLDEKQVLTVRSPDTLY
jgi:AraC-like DNA-binding protein